MSDTTEASALFKTLEALLVQERRAVASFDAKALSLISGQKLEIIEQLKAQGAPLFKERTQRLLVQAEANQALLRDTLATVTEVLGLKPQSKTYDRRARFLEKPSALINRAL